MADDPQAASGGNFKELEQNTVDAFDKWHTFHEDLVSLGDFTKWLGEGENQIDLVTFFALDRDNLDSYRAGLDHQIDFLEGLRQMLEATRETLEDYVKKQDN